MGDVFEARVVEERPNAALPWLVPAWLGLGVLATLTILALHALSTAASALASALLIPSWLVAALAMIPIAIRLTRHPRRSAVLLRIDDRGISIDGKFQAARETLVSGALHAEDGTQRVIFSRRRRGHWRWLGNPRALVLQTTNDASARHMLAAAGFDTAQRVHRARFILPRSFLEAALPLAIYFGGCFSSIAIHSRSFGWMYAQLFLSAALAGTYLYAFSRTVVTVGADGVVIRRRFRSRFLAFADVEAVVTENATLLVLLRTGEWVTLARTTSVYSMMRFNPTAPAMARELLSNHVHEALRSFRARVAGAGSATTPARSTLQRGGREPTAWIASLRAIGAGATGYRENATRVDELERILGDTSAAPDVRAGAAMALRVAEPEAAARIRVAAEATAAPELREALEAIAAERDDDIEVRLARVGR